MSDRTFEYLLNAFEQASQSEKPAENGYAAKRKALFAHVAALVGDGTPGPAREGALIEEACRLYDRGRARDFDTAPEGYKIFMREEIAPIVRMVLASGDSVGPREAAPDDLVSARWEILALTRQLDEWAKRYAALRAELGRAPNGWEPSEDDPKWLQQRIAELEARGYRVNDPRARADAERREPAP